MKTIIRKFFCGSALKDCLERESDLTTVIEELIKENSISVNELNELNEQYREEIDSLQSKVAILNKLLNRQEVNQLIDVVATCPKNDKCLHDKADILRDLKRLKDEAENASSCENMFTLCISCGNKLNHSS